MSRLATLILAMGACAGPGSLARQTACDEQAVAWCDRVDPGPTHGCGIVYRHWCGVAGDVASDAQDACLDAIATMSPDPLTGWYVPSTCKATWATP